MKPDKHIPRMLKKKGETQHELLLRLMSSFSYAFEKVFHLYIKTILDLIIT